MGGRTYDRQTPCRRPHGWTLPEHQILESGRLRRQWMLNAKGSALLNRPRPYSVRLPYTLTQYIPVHSFHYLHRNDGDGTPRMTCGWRHNHPPPRVAKPTSPTAWTGRHRRVADSPIPPPTFHDQSRIPTAAGGARGQRCTTHSHTATHHHHTSPPPTPSALGGNHNMQQAADWGTRPRRPLLAPPSQQQQRTSARHVPSSRHRLTGSQARGRLRIRARAILDCMCCDVPQSTPHTTAGNACRWARRCRLVMESLTHKTADPSPSTRTTTACAPPAS